MTARTMAVTVPARIDAESTRASQRNRRSRWSMACGTAPIDASAQAGAASSRSRAISLPKMFAATDWAKRSVSPVSATPDARVITVAAPMCSASRERRWTSGAVMPPGPMIPVRATTTMATAACPNAAGGMRRARATVETSATVSATIREIEIQRTPKRVASRSLAAEMTSPSELILAPSSL